MLGVKNGLNWFDCFRSLETDLARLEDQLKPDKTNRLAWAVFLSLFLKPFAVVLVYYVFTWVSMLTCPFQSISSTSIHKIFTLAWTLACKIGGDFKNMELDKQISNHDGRRSRNCNALMRWAEDQHQFTGNVLCFPTVTLHQRKNTTDRNICILLKRKSSKGHLEAKQAWIEHAKTAVKRLDVWALK